MRPLTLTRSKSMIPVANKPLLEWMISFLDFAEEIIIVVNEKQEDIIEFCEKHSKCKIVYQKKQLGTAHALAQCEDMIKGKFIMINGDELIPKKYIENLAKQEPYVIGTQRVPDPEKFGVIIVEDGKIKDIIEKPDSPQSDLIRCGMNLFDKRIFDAIRKIGKSKRNEYELTDAEGVLIKEGIEFRPFEVSERLTISYPWHFLDMNKFILDTFGSQISESAEIRPGAVIEEPVAIGDESIIGPNCFIRKYSSIGKNCKIGQAVEVKNSIILDNTYVSHLSYVGDSIIGENCNIGGGVMFANLRLDEKNVKMDIEGKRIDSGKRKLGGIVGDDVKFGTNVTVMPGKKIWPNILVPPCVTITKDIKEQIALKDAMKNRRW